MYVPALKLVREAYLYITIKSLISQSCNRLRMRILIPDWREGDSFSERRKAATGSFSHFPPNPLAQRNKKNQQMLVLFIWRREGDSNPRYGCPYTHFPGVLLQPLGHLSKILRHIIPQPLGPIIATNSFSSILNETSSSARVVASPKPYNLLTLLSSIRGILKECNLMFVL